METRMFQLFQTAPAAGTRATPYLPVLARLTLGLMVGAAGSAAWAAEPSFPKQAIRLILPFPPGSGTDGTARVLGNEISAATGQSVLLDHKAGDRKSTRLNSSH